MVNSVNQIQINPEPVPAPITVEQAMNAAVEFHRLGHLQEAGQLYHAVMQTDPMNVDALHLSGVLAFQTGKPEMAVELIGFAIDREPGIADFHNNIGEVHRSMSDNERAESSYRRALEIDPDHIDAQSNLAELLEDVAV